MTRTRGFTLVEMLVALFVFAILAAASAGVLGYSLQSQETLEENSDRLAHVQLARAVLKADLGQLADRRTRDAFGDARPSFTGQDDVDGEPVLTLVRKGWRNPGGRERRSSLQYVEYTIADGALIRRSWLRPDLTASTPVREQVLLRGVRAISVSFLDGEEWRESWLSADGERTIPAVVAVEMDLDDIGRFRQLFLTPEAT